MSLLQHGYKRAILETRFRLTTRSILNSIKLVIFFFHLRGQLRSLNVSACSAAAVLFASQKCESLVDVFEWLGVTFHQHLCMYQTSIEGFTASYALRYFQPKIATCCGWSWFHIFYCWKKCTPPLTLLRTLTEISSTDIISVAPCAK